MAARPSLPKILNVAEKNDAAKELAKVMSGRRGFQRVRNVFIQCTHHYMTPPSLSFSLFYSVKDFQNLIKYMNSISTSWEEYVNCYFNK